ncbi:MAG: PTS sugar transporter subunit IIA [Verrucomicrobiota bacterium]|nr:PTS sugar transporter subunit IIA [Verrucomicrobiota bacterium]
MKIVELLKPELVALDLHSTSKCPAIREVADLLQKDARVLDFKKFYEELLARERAYTTSLGFELAFPHARIDQLTDMVVAVGRSLKGVDFEEKGNPEVKLIFVIGTPKRMAQDYLRLVGSLARILKNEDTRTRLISAVDVSEFLKVLAEAESRI